MRAARFGGVKYAVVEISTRRRFPNKVRVYIITLYIITQAHELCMS